jgi:hypothetical protein
LVPWPDAPSLASQFWCEWLTQYVNGVTDWCLVQVAVDNWHGDMIQC